MHIIMRRRTSYCDYWRQRGPRVQAKSIYLHISTILAGRARGKSLLLEFGRNMIKEKAVYIGLKQAQCLAEISLSMRRIGKVVRHEE